MRMLFIISLLALTFCLGGITAFSLNNGNIKATTALRSVQRKYHDSKETIMDQSRRAWFVQISTAASVIGATSMMLPCSPSDALVYVDPDRYGDKELQVGIVNKVRQNVRDAVLENPSLAPLFVELAIQDALSYSRETQEGGPNGHVVSLILQDRTSPLYTAALALVEIQAKLQRTTEITMADLVSFGGAEAIESLGGPRIVVQLGKLDTSASPNEKDQQLYDLQNGPQTIQAFQKAGLTEREVTLLFGAMQSMTMALSSNNNESTTSNEDDDEEPNEMGDPTVDFPLSFGGPSQIYGKQLGKMNDKVFQKELALQKKKQATGVWSNEVVAEWTQRYSKGGFFRDLPEAYSRLITVGSTGRWEV